MSWTLEFTDRRGGLSTGSDAARWRSDRPSLVDPRDAAGLEDKLYKRGIR